jgi:hypothetical protein
MSEDLMGLLALLNTSASGKKQSGNIESMIDYLMNPWLGVMTGGYDPLSSVSTPPARYKMDQIAADPEAPAALKSIAASISQGVPLYRVLVDIDSLPDKGGMTGDELKSIAKQLDSEQQQFVQAQSKPASDIFSKAGLPAMTERYSDRPELAPLSLETGQAISGLVNQSDELRRQYELLAGTAKRNAAGYKKPTSYEQALKDVTEAEAAYKLATEKVPTKDKPAANITENPFGVTYGDDGVSMTPNTPENMRKLATKELARLKSAKKTLAATPKDRKPAFNENWGDLNDPATVKRYLQAQATLQESNRLAAEAGRTQSKAIAKGEAEGRTPLMDMLAQRILASRLMGA